MHSAVSGLNGEVTYDYVFGGPRSAVSHSTLKLTSPPGKCVQVCSLFSHYQTYFSLDSEIKNSILFSTIAS